LSALLQSAAAVHSDGSEAGVGDRKGPRPALETLHTRGAMSCGPSPGCWKPRRRNPAELSPLRMP
jgi:hypothetical protein